MGQEIQIDIEKFQKSYITIVLVELLNRMEPKLMQKYLNTTSDPPQPDGDSTRYFDTEPLLTTDSTVTKKLVVFALSLLNNKKPELDLTDIVEENMADGDNKQLHTLILAVEFWLNFDKIITYRRENPDEYDEHDCSIQKIITSLANITPTELIKSSPDDPISWILFFLYYAEMFGKA